MIGLRSDPQEIVAIRGPGESEFPTHRVGWPLNRDARACNRSVTKIVPFAENGQSAVVAWFAVYVGDRVTHRVNAAHIAEVTYAQPEQEKPDAD